MRLPLNRDVNMSNDGCAGLPLWLNNIAVNISNKIINVSSNLSNKCKFFTVSFLSGAVLLFNTILTGGWNYWNRCLKRE